MEVDLGEIDNKLREINPSEIYYEQQSATETKSAEGKIRYPSELSSQC